MTKDSMIPIIGICGRASSGKDTVGRMLLEAEPGGRRFAFATLLKQVCRDVLRMSDDDLTTDEGKSRASRFTHSVCPNCASWVCRTVVIDGRDQVECASCGAVGHAAAFAKRWTNREIVQYIGEKFRDINDAAWADVVIDQIAALSKLKKGRPRFAVVTDCRYRSEVDAVRAAGGVVWRLRRPETDGRQVGIVNHPSETELDRIPESVFERTIVNDASLDELREKVQSGLRGVLAG